MAYAAGPIAPLSLSFGIGDGIVSDACTRAVRRRLMTVRETPLKINDNAVHRIVVVWAVLRISCNVFDVCVYFEAYHCSIMTNMR